MIDALLNSEVGDMGGSGLIIVVIRLSEIMHQYCFKNLSFSIPSFIDYSILSESPNDLLDFQTVTPMPIMNNERNKKRKGFFESHVPSVWEKPPINPPSRNIVAPITLKRIFL